MNPKTLYRGKSLRVLLGQQLPASKQIILWHDVLNNSISSDRTNNYKPCPLDELLAYLNSKRKQISAIVCCGRTSSPDVFQNLRKIEIIDIETTDNFTSRSKRQKPAFLKEYLQLQQSSELELNSLRVLLPIDTTRQEFSRRYWLGPRNHRRDAGHRRGGQRCRLGTFSWSRTTNSGKILLG